jgi:hypothetical protein
MGFYISEILGVFIRFSRPQGWGKRGKGEKAKRGKGGNPVDAGCGAGLRCIMAYLGQASASREEKSPGIFLLFSLFTLSPFPLFPFSPQDFYVDIFSFTRGYPLQ